jgi:hypothetical protein
MDNLPEGLLYVPDFLTVDEERDLVQTIEAIDFRPIVMRGQTARRTVRHFGLDYAYETGDLVEAEPLPASLEWLRASGRPR